MEWPYEIAERDHEIQNPTSPEKICELGRYLRLNASSSVLDLACGKAGPAIILASEFGCHVTGVEIRQGFAEAGRRRVADAGLVDLIEIRIADASTYEFDAESYDAALCIGASFVWGHIGDAAPVLVRAVKPDGGVAIGEPFWRTRPLASSRHPESFVDLVATVSRFEHAGLSLVGLIAASEDDWDHYRSPHWRAIAEWLSENPGHPDAEEIRRGDAEQRLEYLSVERAGLGWAIFVGRRT